MSFRLSRKPASLAALLVLGAGLALTGILSIWLANSEAKRQQKAFEHAADVRQAAFQQEFEDTLQELAQVNRLFSGNGKVNREQFEELAGQLVELHPYVQAYTFVRTLPGEHRQAFEARMQQVHGNSVVTELRDGRVVPAAKRPHYEVIDHIAPARTNTGALGLDISTLPGMDRAVEHARTTGLPSATDMFNLLPEAGGYRAFAVLMPVYREGTAARNAGAREDAVIGYTSVVLRATAFVETVMRRITLLQEQDNDVRIFVDNGQDAELVYQTSAGNAGDPDLAINAEWQAERRASGITRSVDAGDTRWLLVSKRSPQGFGSRSTSAWLVLAGGVAVSVLLALFLQSIAVRAADLARVNTRLKEDINARKRIESALRASEERFQRLACMSSDWYWEQDAEFRFTMVSGDTVFGEIPTQALLGKTRWEAPLEVEEKDFEEHVRVLKSHKPFSDLEYRARGRNGRVYWMSVSGEPMFGREGEFLGYRGTGKDITERKETEQALRQSQTELRELTAHQARIKEDERKRIAREIHDDLGQNLLALRIDVSLLENELRLSNPDIKERIHGLLSQVDNVVHSIRTIINDLRPPVLDLGLQCALEWQVHQFRQRSGVSCTLVTEGGDLDSMLDEEAATSVFRILQESLTNVSRHAYATHVDIRLQRKFDNLVLEIADDGVGGFPGNMRKPRSFGLIGIRERVYTLGGEFRLASAPGKGTTLTITIPASATSAAAA